MKSPLYRVNSFTKGKAPASKEAGAFFY